MKDFGVSILVAIVCLGLGGWWGWTQGGGFEAALAALWIVAVLSVMEVSLSFDNAVVNASVLRDWSAFWQKLFLTVGILIAVFGMRLVFPVVIVALTSDMTMLQTWNMALDDPNEYSARLSAHHQEISAFGGIFLLLVFLNFVLDDDKDTHWLHWIESRLASLGKINAVSVFVALLVLVASLSLVDDGKQYAVLMAGLTGLLVYLGVDVLSSLLESEESDYPKVRDLAARVKLLVASSSSQRLRIAARRQSA